MHTYAHLNFADFQIENPVRNTSCQGTKTSPNAVNVVAGEIPGFAKHLDIQLDFGVSGIWTKTQK